MRFSFAMRLVLLHVSHESKPADYENAPGTRNAARHPKLLRLPRDPEANARAHIAPHAIYSERASELRCVGYDHRAADGMIDRAENAEREQRCGEREEVG